MLDETYKFGDKVEVMMPDGRWHTGLIATVLPNYAWSGETRYSVHGIELVTIVSARNMRIAPKQNRLFA